MSYSYRNNVGENRVLPPVCIAHDCTQCVQNWIHNLCYIKTYVYGHNVLSSKRADNIRPYEFVTFTKFVLTYHLYDYLRANTVRHYSITVNLVCQQNYNYYKTLWYNFCLYPNFQKNDSLKRQNPPKQYCMQKSFML